MKVTYGPVVAQASGSIGGNVASHNRYGTYWRTRAIPVTSTTPAALAAKSRLTNASQGWLDITDDQRIAWALWAQNNPITDRLGAQQVLQGNAAYCMLNTRVLQAGGALQTDPPIISAPTPLLTLTQTCDIGAGAFALTYTATPTGAGDGLFIQVAVVNSVGINYVKNLMRVVVITGVAEASPYDHEAAVVAVFGELQVDQKVVSVVSVMDIDTGLLSAPLRVDTLIVST